MRFVIKTLSYTMEERRFETPINILFTTAWMETLKPVVLGI